MFEVGQTDSLWLLGLIITVVVLHIHHHLSGHTCLQSPTNNNTENSDYANILHFQTITQTLLDESVLVKLQELIVWLSKLLESLLVDQVCFATVALVLIFLRPSNVKGCLCHSYSLRLHVPVNVQRLRAVLCLMTHMYDKSYYCCISCESSKNSKRLKYYTYKFDPEFHISRVVVIFLLVCESGHNLLQQCGKVAFLSALREGLLCPLNIPVRQNQNATIKN